MIGLSRKVFIFIENDIHSKDVVKKNLHFNWKCTYPKDFVKKHLYSDWKYTLRILWRKFFLSRTICILIERYSYFEDFVRKNLNLIWNCTYFFVKKHLYSDWKYVLSSGFFSRKNLYFNCKVYCFKNLVWPNLLLLTCTYYVHKNTAVTKNSSFAFEWAVSDFKIPTGSALIYSQVWSHVAVTICSLTLHRIHTYHPWIRASTQTCTHTRMHTHMHCGFNVAAKWWQRICVVSAVFPACSVTGANTLTCLIIKMLSLKVQQTQTP